MGRKELKFNKGKCKFLHLGTNNPMHQHRLGVNLLENLCKKDLGVLVDNKQCDLLAKIMSLGRTLQQVKRGDLATPFSPSETMSGVLSTRETWSFWSGSRATKVNKEPKLLSYEHLFLRIG